MKKIFGMLFAAAVYFCVATVVAQVVALGVLFSKGTISTEKTYRMMAIVHEVQGYPLVDEDTGPVNQADEQIDFTAVARQRALSSSDMTLRENAIDKGLRDMIAIRYRLQDDIDKFKDLKADFVDALDNLEKKADDEGIGQLQRTLEAVKPKQAKDLILKLVEDGAMDDVVAILEGMSIDKRKKIVAEFKSQEESDTLHRILIQMRDGDVPIINEAQKKMNAQFKSNPQ